MRTSRWRENAKSKRPHQETPEQTPTTQKRFIIGSPRRDSYIVQDDYLKQVDEIRKAWEGNRSVSHLRTLLKETRSSRLQWQSTLKAGEFSPILEKFQCFQEGSFNKAKPDEERLQIAERMEWLMKIVAENRKDPLDADLTQENLRLLEDLEIAVKQTKGKGKSKTCIEVVTGLQNLEAVETHKSLKSANFEAPKLVLFDCCEQIVSYITGDGVKIFGQTILLLAVYYVCDLEYPPMYSQFLGLIQHWVLNDPFTANKCSSFIQFSDIVANRQDKPSF